MPLNCCVRMILPTFFPPSQSTPVFHQFDVSFRNAFKPFDTCLFSQKVSLASEVPTGNLTNVNGLERMAFILENSKKPHRGAEGIQMSGHKGGGSKKWCYKKFKRANKIQRHKNNNIASHEICQKMLMRGGMLCSLVCRCVISIRHVTGPHNL